jgi:hypothetical protein
MGMQWTISIAAIAMLAGVTACANVQTIDRSKQLPPQSETIQRGQQSEKQWEKALNQSGTAIHLDAQQRLVLATINGYCAEPSPDALAAYASSLGLGVSAPSQGAASLAAALQSSAGSIGLRTQSITLMRDGLYRMCEAANNGRMSNLEVAAFLRRSQDLTAVVLAIEQLTGAVSAQQIILSGKASADASAAVLVTQQRLDQANELVVKREGQVEEAKTSVTAAEEAAAEADSEKTAKANAYAAAKQADEGETKPATIKAKEAAEKAEKDAATKADELADAKETLELRNKQLADAKTARDALEVARDGAITSASASTSSSGQFGSAVQAKSLDAATTAAIADSVESMVKHALDKDYTTDLCMSYVISSSPGNATADRICTAALANAAENVFGDRFAEGDPTVDAVQKLIDDGKISVEDIRKWLKSKGSSVRSSDFRTAASAKALRQEFLDTKTGQ